MVTSPEPLLRLAHSADYGPRIVEIAIDAIDDQHRMRALDPAWVAAMAAEIEGGATLPPIAVRRPEPDEKVEREFALIFGGHRLAASRSLGLKKVRAEIRKCTRLEGLRDEAKENLIRNELTALDRAYFLRELKRVYEQLHPETAHGGDRKSRKTKDKIKSQSLGLEPQRFTLEAAKICNLSEASVQAAIALIDALAPEAITLLRGTETARNGSELQRLAAKPADQQVEIARQLREGRAKNVAAAGIAAGVAPTGEGDEQEDLFRRICSTYARLDAKTKRRFLDHARLTERKPRERMPTVSEVIGGEA